MMTLRVLPALICVAVTYNGVSLHASPGASLGLLEEVRDVTADRRRDCRGMLIGDDEAPFDFYHGLYDSDETV